MSGTRSETGERDRMAEMVSEGGRGSSECRDGRREAQEEERSGGGGGGKERKILHKRSREEHWERSTRACTGSRRGRRAVPSLRSFRPLARQTALRSTQKSRAFCGARSSLHLRTDPLTRCHRTLRSARSFVRSFVGSLVCLFLLRGLFRSRPLFSISLHHARVTPSREPHDSPSGAAPPVIASFE